MNQSFLSRALAYAGLLVLLGAVAGLLIRIETFTITVGSLPPISERHILLPWQKYVERPTTVPSLDGVSTSWSCSISDCFGHWPRFSKEPFMLMEGFEGGGTQCGAPLSRGFDPYWKPTMLVLPELDALELSNPAIFRATRTPRSEADLPSAVRRYLNTVDGARVREEPAAIPANLPTSLRAE